MSDFRYNETAEALEDTLEDVLDTHKQEVEEKQAEAAAALPSGPSALERIAQGSFKDQVTDLLTSEGKVASDLLTEHRVRTALQDGQASRMAAVDDFLNLAKS